VLYRQSVFSTTQVALKLTTGKSPQQYIAVGDDSGTLHILETPRVLLKPMKSEKQNMSSFYDREFKRLLAGAGRKLIHAKGRVVFDAKLAEKIAVSLF
jgi:dynein intermediate chain 3, axonemal